MVWKILVWLAYGALVVGGNKLLMGALYDEQIKNQYFLNHRPRYGWLFRRLDLSSTVSIEDRIHQSMIQLYLHWMHRRPWWPADHGSYGAGWYYSPTRGSRRDNENLIFLLSKKEILYGGSHINATGSLNAVLTVVYRTILTSTPAPASPTSNWGNAHFR